jgi:hypothetical protein
VTRCSFAFDRFCAQRIMFSIAIGSGFHRPACNMFSLTLKPQHNGVRNRVATGVAPGIHFCFGVRSKRGPVRSRKTSSGLHLPPSTSTIAQTCDQFLYQKLGPSHDFDMCFGHKININTSACVFAPSKCGIDAVFGLMALRTEE